ncbi:MAG TPA: TonB-dependent receptor, partial [Candidatus Acidoferrales bacterium]
MARAVVCLLALVGCPPLSQAQEVTQVHVSGVVKTPQGTPVPGATVGLVHIPTGKAWVSWTNDQGEFALPGMPPGRYRIEVQQIGFAESKSESEFVGVGAPRAEITLRVATLAELAPRPRTAPAGEPSTPENPPAQGAQPPAQQRRGPGQAPPGGRPAGPGPQQQPNAQSAIEALRQRMAQQGGFQDIDPTMMGQAAGAGTDIPGQLPGAPGANGTGTGPLGDASSADAFLISGTVGRGATAGSEEAFLMGVMGAFGGFGGFGGPGGPGGGGGNPFGGQGDAAGAGGRPGMVILGGGPGGGMAGRGGAAGGGRPGQQQQRGGQQGQQRGAQGQQQGQQRTAGAGFGAGQEGLWGLQRLLRQAANRTRFGFNSRFGHSAMDARPYSLTGQPQEQVSSWRANFGVNIGGPLRIPKIYDGREKTFFFVNYDLNRRRNPVDTFSTVPLAEERGGDFTARGVQLFDPFSNIDGPRTSLGSVIPSSMIDPAAAGLLRFIPLPNLPGNVQNFRLRSRVPQSTDRFNIRINHTITQRLNFSASYNLNSVRSRGLQAFPTLENEQGVLGQNVMLGLTQTLTPRLIHDTRINWNRNRINILNGFAFVEDIAGNLGITGISTDPLNFGVPQVNFTNFGDLNDTVPSLRRSQTFRFMDNITYAMPKHTLRAGFEMRRMQTNTVNDPTARGNFSFTGLMSAQLDANGQPIPGTGFDFADFLLGLPQATTVRFGSSRTYFRNWAFQGYVQDDWRVHPRFTLSGGLRYEAITPPVELFDKLANLDLNSDITAVALVLPGQTGPFSGSLPRSLVRGDYNNWSPRIGIAWRPKLKRPMTVRAGYSIFFNTSVYNQLSAQLANQPPHAEAQTRLTSVANLLTLVDGFPAVTPGDVPNTVAVDPNYRVGYAQLWNVSVETQIVRSLTVDLTYTGTKGTHLDMLRAPNRALPGNPFETEDSRRIPGAPGFTYNTFGASSIYHALQVRVQRRMNRGMMMMGTYTFGKSIDNASSIGGGAQTVVLNDLNFRAERGLSSFDVRHQFRSFFVYELPFGERRKWAKRGWQAAAFSNISLNGNVTLQSGTPFTARVLGSAANNSGTGANFSERADQIGDPVLSSGQRTTNRWFNTAAF